MYREMKADVLLAVGGGSTLDSAKGIAIIGESDKTIYDIAGVMGTYDPYKPLPWKTYPMIAVPTTCGSGSEVIHNAVISEADGHKLVPMHDAILPAYAVCDPDLLATLPPCRGGVGHGRACSGHRISREPGRKRLLPNHELPRGRAHGARPRQILSQPRHS
jgi:alcohol dehydrogenase YqhD (iron-dependent ADH family)